MARTRPFERPVRRIDTPTLVMIRQCHTHFDGKSRPIPIDRVPIERRTGELTVVLSLSGLAISGPETGDAYPQSPSFEYARGCEVFLEVYPRGRTREEYARWQREAMVRIVPLEGARTPLFISAQASANLGGASRPGSDGLSQMRLVQPPQLLRYLTGALPLLGVEPADVNPAAQHVRTLLLQGKQRLNELSAKLGQRRQ